MQDANLWIEFLKEAEQAWLRIFDSGKRTNLVSPDGAPLRRLPIRWQSRRNIYYYFRRWWGPRLASNMLKNLPIFERGGTLYVAAYDVPPISLKVQNITEINDTNPKKVLLTAVLVGGFDEPLIIQYIITKHTLTKHFMIVNRSDVQDFRYRNRHLEE